MGTNLHDLVEDGFLRFDIKSLTNQRKERWIGVYQNFKTWFQRILSRNENRTYRVGEIIFNHIFGKGLVTRIFTELLELKNKKQMTHLKKWAKDLNKDIYSKINKWPKSPWKDVQHSLPLGKCQSKPWDAISYSPRLQ